jgi:hypothetical protein
MACVKAALERIEETGVPIQAPAEFCAGVLAGFLLSRTIEGAK